MSGLPGSIDVTALGAEFRQNGFVAARGAFAAEVAELQRIGEEALDRFSANSTEANQPSGRYYSPKADADSPESP